MYLDLLAGGRYWYLNGDIDVGAALTTNRNLITRNISQSGSKEWIDPFVGLRTRIQLSKNLMLVLRGDIGGFSVGSQFLGCFRVFGIFSVGNGEPVGRGYRDLG